MVTNSTLSNIVEYYPDGTPQTAEWRENGRLHRTDGPAEIHYYPDGTIQAEYWWQNGEPYRDGAPARTLYNENGSIKNERWLNQNGQYHRTDGPARTDYYNNGNIKSEGWWKNGDLHRTDGPAHIGYWENGLTQSEEWYQDGKKHRTDGPAHIGYWEDGSIECEQWCSHGETPPRGRPRQYLLQPGRNRQIQRILAERETSYDTTPHTVTIMKQKKNPKTVTDTNTPPDIIVRNPNGNIRREQWFNKNRQLHRTDGPASVTYRENGGNRTRRLVPGRETSPGERTSHHNLLPQ